jgi:hypothetical protein
VSLRRHIFPVIVLAHAVSNSYLEIRLSPITPMSTLGAPAYALLKRIDPSPVCTVKDCPPPFIFP